MSDTVKPTASTARASGWGSRVAVTTGRGASAAGAWPCATPATAAATSPAASSSPTSRPRTEWEERSTTGMSGFPLGNGRHAGHRGSQSHGGRAHVAVAHPEPLQQVVANAQRVRHDRERRIHRTARRKEAPVHDVQVVHVVCLAVHVERGRRRIVAEPDRAVLMSHTGERNALAEEQASREDADVTVLAVDRARALTLEQLMHLPAEPAVALLVVRRIREHDVAAAVDRDAIARVRQVLARQPEIE